MLDSYPTREELAAARAAKDRVVELANAWRERALIAEANLRLKEAAIEEYRSARVLTEVL